MRIFCSYSLNVLYYSFEIFNIFWLYHISRSRVILKEICMKWVQEKRRVEEKAALLLLLLLRPQHHTVLQLVLDLNTLLPSTHSPIFVCSSLSMDYYFLWNDANTFDRLCRQCRALRRMGAKFCEECGTQHVLVPGQESRTPPPKEPNTKSIN
jgi:ribosomal protein L40E